MLVGFYGKIDGDVVFLFFNVGVYVLFVEMFNYCGVKDIDFVDKVGDKQVFWFFVDFLWGVVLFDFVIMYYYDVIGYGQSFFLIVGDEDEGDFEFMLQCF